MTDRQKIMSDLEGLTFDDWHMFHCDSDVQGIATDALELLKSQPEQKRGHWKAFTQSRYFGNDDDGEPIFRDGRFYVCSECRRKTVIKTQFCPRCGAKMDEEVKHHDQKTQAEAHQADHPLSGVLALEPDQHT